MKQLLAGGGVVAALAFGGGCAGGGTNPHHGFCATHDCIPSFEQGKGSVVQCEDGMWSHSGGLPGACSHHGGEKGEGDFDSDGNPRPRNDGYFGSGGG